MYDFCTAVSVNPSTPAAGVVGRPSRSNARSSHKNYSGEDGAVTGTDFVGVEMYAKLTAFIESYVRDRLEVRFAVILASSIKHFKVIPYFRAHGTCWAKIYYVTTQHSGRSSDSHQR